MGAFAEFGAAVDEIIAASRLEPSAPRRDELQHRAVYTMAQYFLFGTNWIPAPQVPEATARRWWDDALRILTTMVQQAWAGDRNRMLIVQTGLIAERFPVDPEDAAATSWRLHLACTIFDVAGGWPELVPASRSIPAVQVPTVRAPTASAPSTLAAVYGINAAAFATLNDFGYTTLNNVGIADAERFRSQQQWDQQHRS